MPGSNPRSDCGLLFSINWNILLCVYFVCILKSAAKVDDTIAILQAIREIFSMVAFWGEKLFHN